MKPIPNGLQHLSITCLVLIMATAFCLAAGTPPLFACTTFQLKSQGHVFFGRNYDWDFADGLIIINQAGLIKPGYKHQQEKGKRASWTAKYGSLTFNQYGRELPTGGMNSAGLVLESMSLSDSELPAPDQRPYLAFASLWKQYILDNFATVAEALEGIKKVRIRQSARPAHFLISDATGDCAVIEFLKGKQVVYHGSDLPVPVLANSTYAESLRYFERDSSPWFDWWSSIKRFKTGATMVQAYSPAQNKDPVAYSYRVLEAVADEDDTQWSIVYDQTRRMVYIRTKLNPNIRYIDLNRLDFTCKPPLRIADLNGPGKGDITGKFIGYTYAANRRLIGSSFGKTSFLDHIPKEGLDRLATYPDKCRCSGP